MEQRDELAGIGERLRAIRESRGLTLKAVSEASGISTSTLSRLESGSRRAQLDLLLPLARLYRLPLDDLVGAPALGDPRIHPRPKLRHGVVTVPLSGGAGPWEAFKQVHPPTPETPIRQFVHPGWDWIYVISGRMRLLLGDDDLVIEAGEAAEFDTRVPHGFANHGDDLLEVLCLFNAQGAKVHTRASA
ncbi:helix-turn-helix domain-containing protein [Agromyces aureus]|uniref:XRE family transcriptional regulator n=1 Tax=Agromyces aureus TaxID=453304 RepID=A0A191WCZ8_9MICO|nr:helix-turn-helix domain-containing protein [Agromyces aureus]ANJ26102.1 XRE family transcriptional regulator [Agromyces aureus]